MRNEPLLFQKVAALINDEIVYSKCVKYAFMYTLYMYTLYMYTLYMYTLYIYVSIHLLARQGHDKFHLSENSSE